MDLLAEEPALDVGRAIERNADEMARDLSMRVAQQHQWTSSLSEPEEALHYGPNPRQKKPEEEEKKGEDASTESLRDRRGRPVSAGANLVAVGGAQETTVLTKRSNPSSGSSEVSGSGSKRRRPDVEEVTLRLS